MKKVLVALVSLSVALVALELLQRTALRLKGTPYSAAETASELQRRLDPTRRFVPTAPGGGGDSAALVERRRPLLHPYTGTESGHDTGGVLRAFREGFEPDQYVIVVVGGSVGASWALANESRVPELLQADERFAGKRVRILNYAHASYKQPQQLMRMGYLFSLGYRPDAVIAIDGFNEVALSLQNLNDRTHPVYPPPPVWGAIVRSLNVLDDDYLAHAGELWTLRLEAERIVSRTLGLRLHHSSLLGWLAGKQMAQLDRRRFEAYERHQRTVATSAARTSDAHAERQRRGPDFDPRPQAVLAAGARNWLESSLSLHAMCAARDIFYLHVLQPTLHDEAAKPFSDEERELGPVPTGWDVGARRGYPLLRAHAPALEAHGVSYFDASRLFEDVQRTIYVDHCHLNNLGNRLLGDAVAQAFLQALPSQ